jgi:hypothetical protein
MGMHTGLEGKYLVYKLSRGINSCPCDGTQVVAGTNISIPVIEPAANVVATGSGFARRNVGNWTPKFLEYQASRVTETILTRTILTGEMSGCLIMIYSRRGQRRVCHVGTVSNRGSQGSKLARARWRNIAADPLNTLIGGFNPLKAIRNNLIMPANKPIAGEESGAVGIVYAIVSNSGKFYALILNRVNPGKFGLAVNPNFFAYRVAKMKSVPSMSLTKMRNPWTY